MICSIRERFGCDLEQLTFEQLVEERRRLLPELLSYEQNPVPENGQDPSPEAIYRAESEQLARICEILRVKHFEEYLESCHATFTRNELVGVIDRVLKNSWLTDIVADYSDNFLLKEDALKCASYHYLRTKLGRLVAEHSLRIYPEYYISSLNYFVDLAVVKIDSESDKGHLKDSVTDVLTLIELKYTSGSTVISSIKHDITKMKEYREHGFLAQCYWGIIYEDVLKGSGWTDKRTTNRWANGNLTLLTADLRDDALWFEVESFNGMNVDVVE